MVLGAAAPLVGGLVGVTGGCVVVMIGGCVGVVIGGCVVVGVGGWVVGGGGVVVGVVVEVAVSELAEVLLPLGAGPGAVDDDGGAYTVGVPSSPVRVTVSVSVAPGIAGSVTAGTVFGLLLL